MDTLKRVTGLILLNNSNQIALQLRDDFAYIKYSDQWGLFGGHVDEGESVKDCGLREAWEELTVKLDPAKLELLFEHDQKDGRLVYVFLYRVEDELDVANLREGAAWRWCAHEEIMNGTIEGKSVMVHAQDMVSRYFNL